ncbi:MAG: hypothetical protein Q9159_007500 [Coniocarpon cinnabarinum]
MTAVHRPREIGHQFGSSNEDEEENGHEQTFKQVDQAPEVAGRDVWADVCRSEEQREMEGRSRGEGREGEESCESGVEEGLEEEDPQGDFGGVQGEGGRALVGFAAVLRNHSSKKMSWFRTTPQETPDPSQNTDGSYKPLARSEREACWTARDAYFTCLDRNGILDSLKDAEEARRVCGAQEEAFARDCASSWVSSYTFHLHCIACCRSWFVVRGSQFAVRWGALESIGEKNRREVIVKRVQTFKQSQKRNQHLIQTFTFERGKAGRGTANLAGADTSISDSKWCKEANKNCQVKYFKQKRVAEYEKEQKFKEYDAEGALPMAQGQKPWYQVW